AWHRTLPAGDALLETVLVAHQHLLAAVLGEHRHLLVRVVHRNLWLEHVPEGRPQPGNQRSDHRVDHIWSTSNSQLPTPKERRFESVGRREFVIGTCR